MSERFELSELDDIASFLELVEESDGTVFVTIGGRDRFAVLGADKYAALRASSIQEQRKTQEAEQKLSEAQSQVEDLTKQIELLENQLEAVNVSSKITISNSEYIIEPTAIEQDCTQEAVPAEAASTSSDEQLSQPNSNASDSGSVHCKPYETAKLPNTPIDSDDYQRSMWQEAITERMAKVITAEAPVEKQRLFNTVRGSFGIKRSGRDIQSHNEWLFNRNISAKQTEFNGTQFIWRNDQDPETYNIYRPSDETSNRQITEFAYQELLAAITDALTSAPRGLSRDELIEATMRLLGYKRKTNRVRDVIGAAIEQAANDNRIRIFTDGTFRIA